MSAYDCGFIKSRQWEDFRIWLWVYKEPPMGRYPHMTVGFSRITINLKRRWYEEFGFCRIRIIRPYLQEVSIWNYRVQQNEPLASTSRKEHFYSVTSIPFRRLLYKSQELKLRKIYPPVQRHFFKDINILHSKATLLNVFVEKNLCIKSKIKV